jgi:hypothetical protein
MATDITTVSAGDLAKANDAEFALVQRKAQALAASTLVPKQFQNNVANCCIAINMAINIRADVLSVMQSLYVVNGRPAWSSAFLVGCINRCGRYTTIRYEFSGVEGTDNWGCTACATELKSGEELRGSTITIALAKADGWYGRKDSKWKTLPEQMLRYRAAAFWVRAYAPDIALGMYTADELQDSYREATVPGSVITEAEVSTPDAKQEPPATEESWALFLAGIENKVKRIMTTEQLEAYYVKMAPTMQDSEELLELDRICDKRSKELRAEDAQAFDANGLPV